MCSEDYLAELELREPLQIVIAELKAPLGVFV